ncbi:MAG: C40 family peptidase [Deltaproteobacteria bacterium]|nr:C40 family peptidase [Deltaproteobacteria bacterium]
MPVSQSASQAARLPLALLAALIALPLALSGCQTARTSSLRKLPAYASRKLPPVSQESIQSQAAQSRVHKIMKTAFSQVGNPYRYGGNSPETGFDCSGFVSWVYKQYGVNLPRSSRDMLGAGTPIARTELRPGDLVFFNYGYSHVGIYTGDGKYIHSPSTGKRIQESNLNGRGRTEHYVGARRVIDNKGVTAVSDVLKAEWVQASRHSAAMAMNDSAARRHTGAEAYRGRSRSRSATASRRAPARTASRAASGNARTHKVASGDTLVHLAKRYGVTATDLAAYNRIADRDRIRPGQSIKIPPKDSGKSASVSSAAKAKKAKGKAAPKKGASAKGKGKVKAKGGSKSSKGKAKTVPKAKGGKGKKRA